VSDYATGLNPQLQVPGDATGYDPSLEEYIQLDGSKVLTLCGCLQSL
ncbi:hypothetical protein A2U01_0093099, partial [Trifolium medium]|nr:hypothetical protein [Trifolium medium]